MGYAPLLTMRNTQNYHRQVSQLPFVRWAILKNTNLVSEIVQKRYDYAILLFSCKPLEKNWPFQVILGRNSYSWLHLFSYAGLSWSSAVPLHKWLLRERICSSFRTYRATEKKLSGRGRWKVWLFPRLLYHWKGSRTGSLGKLKNE